MATSVRQLCYTQGCGHNNRVVIKDITAAQGGRLMYRCVRCGIVHHLRSMVYMTDVQVPADAVVAEVGQPAAVRAACL